MLATVKQIPLLRDLSAEQLEVLLPSFELCTCPANHPIFLQNEQATHLYLLVNGTVAIQYKPYDGKAMTLTHLHHGDVFGWSAVVGGATYTSSTYSETKVEAVRIHGLALRKLCSNNPEVASIILERLAEAVSGRWKDASKQVQSILQRNLNQSGKSKVR